MQLNLDDFAAKFNLNDAISDVGGLGAHVGEDGRLMFSCEIYGTNEPDAGILAVVIDGQDLTEAHVPKELVPSFGWHKGVAAYKNGLIFLHRKTRPSEDETRATYLPRDGATWGTPQPLAVSPALPIRTTSKGFSKPIMPASKGIGRGDIIAWPVEASTGSPETSVKSVAFFQPDIANGLLRWSYWPEPPSNPGFFAGLWKKRAARDALDFIQPDKSAFASFKTDLDLQPNILSAVFDGTQLLITTDGATVIKKSGDRCASVASVQADGSVSQLYYENFIRADRPDASKRHDYQARFVSGGRKVLLKSRYQSTDPWKGGFALFDVDRQSLTVCKGPKSDDYRGPMEIVGGSAFFADFDAEARCISLRLEKISPV